MNSKTDLQDFSAVLQKCNYSIARLRRKPRRCLDLKFFDVAKRFHFCYRFCMANTQPRRADHVSIEQLEAIVAQLEQIVAQLRTAAVAVKQTHSTGIASYNFPSGIAGLSRLKSFSDAIGDSLLKMQLGTPLQVGEYTSRYRPRSNEPNKSNSQKKPKA